MITSAAAEFSSGGVYTRRGIWRWQTHQGCLSELGGLLLHARAPLAEPSSNEFIMMAYTVYTPYSIYLRMVKHAFTSLDARDVEPPALMPVAAPSRGFAVIAPFNPRRRPRLLGLAAGDVAISIQGLHRLGVGLCCKRALCFC